ncbi:cardioacceleratory peptide receptor [Nasonia vitripennis]|uniref:G-protein coupled receptors family 1 profile domain-containing protein n=1 Tax=Nasonia vitripennis TaxID=7425 RepID=A0A7M7QQH9_NASVI|nr:cardioacceleratory peptide receptor [Nasonia vitripennis]
MFILWNTMSVNKLFVLEEDFEVLLENIRLIFQVLIWPIVITGLISNAAVLVRIILAPSGKFSMLKPFYRCALLSFAISDLMLLISSGSNTLTMVSQRTTLLWKLPDWSCSAVPFFQTVAIFIGSLTLAGIAIDRYRALTPRYPPDDGHKWPYAILFNMLIWLIAMAASYPILGMYEIDSLIVIRPDSTVYEGRICSTNQAHAALVYTALFVTIFIPLALIFVTVHVLLALNIWRRQEQSNKSQLSSGNDSQSTEFSTVSSNAQRRKTPHPQRCMTSNHMRRKKRTVNVILVLIFVFLVGRLPVWIFLVYKLHTKLSGTLWPHLQVVFTALTFVNAALDPFLYAFLCEALSLLTFLQTCTTKKQADVTPYDDERKVAVDINPAIVPRGPYSF